MASCIKEKNLIVFCLSFLFTFGSFLYAKNDPAFKIGKKVYFLNDIKKDNESTFYKLEKQKYDLIETAAKEKYLDYFWQNKAKKEGKSITAVKDEYFKKNAKISSKELSQAFEQFKNSFGKRKLSKKEKEDQIKSYLEYKKKQEIVDGIITAAKAKKEFVISYPKPKEPVFNIKVTSSDMVRYGPNPNDTKPKGCSKNCKVTVVEYSEFQCPFCSRTVNTAKRIMKKYQGKIRWVVRDFPLSFHNRARFASIAAHCAAKQGKYWYMYNTLFKNQRNLSDKDLEKYASSIKGMDKKKWKACYDNPSEVTKIIDKNLQSGMKLGISGTPGFFINGKKLSGAVPYSSFTEIIDDELKAK